jgi:hypothetical protein
MLKTIIDILLETVINYPFVFVSICCFTTIAFLYGLLLISLIRKKGSLKSTNAKYKKSFISTSSPEETFNLIMRFATQNGHAIDDYDEKNLSLVINRKWDVTGNALIYLYPILVLEEEGKTVVEVGLTHKLGDGFINNPLNLRVFPLERMYNEIKNAVSLSNR